MARRVIGRGHPLGWQFNVASPVQFQQEAAGDHVARLPVGLHPVPGLAEQRRESPPAQAGMGGN